MTKEKIVWDPAKALHVLIGSMPEWVEIQPGSLEIHDEFFTCVESPTGKTIVGRAIQLQAVRYVQGEAHVPSEARARLMGTRT
jgi:hypothetical protein